MKHHLNDKMLHNLNAQYFGFQFDVDWLINEAREKCILIYIQIVSIIGLDQLKKIFDFFR